MTFAARRQKMYGLFDNRLVAYYLSYMRPIAAARSAVSTEALFCRNKDKTMAHRKKKISESIAQRIRSDIARTEGAFLPPMRQMGRRYAVSLTTIHSAIALLKMQGIVTAYQGGRIQIVGRDAQPPESLAQPKKPTADRLYAHLRQEIANGTYQRGKPLPKVGYCALSHNVSHHAVTSAYRKLERENLAHKKGRSWIAGPRIIRFPSGNALFQPAIVLLQSNEDFWSHTAKRPFFEAFCRSFQTEVENYNVELLPAVFERRDSAVGIVPAGRDAIMTMIKELGTRYRGCLILNAVKEIPSLSRWIDEMLRLDKPVVWFDRLKENPSFSFNRRRFVRCHEAEQYAVRLALEFLYSVGHRSIAFPSMQDAPWLNRRQAIIEKAAVRAGFDEVHVTQPAAQLFANGDIEAQADYLRRLFDKGIPHIKTSVNFISATAGSLFGRLPAECGKAFARDRFLGAAHLISYLIRHEDRAADLLWDFRYLPWLAAATPVLAPILENQQITAILAPNDMTAHRYYFWLKAVGMNIPRDLSLVSFDNLWFLQHLPVTSVDFGYGYLGFAAFHAIIQDLSLRSDLDGNIAAQPRVVHRGTVSKPATARNTRLFSLMTALA